MQATHVVVDTRDGHTWWKDAAGQLLTLETARGMADKYNAECKPEHRTYEVFGLVHCPGLPTCDTCGERIQRDYAGWSHKFKPARRHVVRPRNVSVPA